MADSNTSVLRAGVDDITNFDGHNLLQYVALTIQYLDNLSPSPRRMPGQPDSTFIDHLYIADDVADCLKTGKDDNFNI
jgi:hypothetical protein